MIRPKGAEALVACLVLSTLFSAANAAALDYPQADKRPVTDHYFDVSVEDPYQWLESVDASDTRAWVAAENALTKKTLGALPIRAALKAELKQMTGGQRVGRGQFLFVHGLLFAMKSAPPKNQEMLTVMNGRGDTSSEKVVIDANQLDPTGNTSIDWYQPSPDASIVAASLSKGGSEDGDLYLFDVKTGRQLADVVPRVQFPTGGGSVAWTGDGKGFYYTRYPQGDERPKQDLNFYQQVYFHQLGTPASADRYVIGKEFPRIAEIELSSSEDGRYVVANVLNGDGGESAIYLKDPSDHWSQLSANADGFRQAAFGRDGRLYAVAVKDAPHGKLVALDPGAVAGGFAAAQVVVPESSGVIESFLVTEHRIYVDELQGGPTEIDMFGLDGQALGPLGSMPIASVELSTRLTGDAILFASESYTQAHSWFSFDPSASHAGPKRLKLADPPAFAPKGYLKDIEAVREFAVSKDGTKVPVTIVYAKGLQLDGSHPTLLTAYGGYSVSLSPHLSMQTALWVKHGGVFAEANLRGGGEFGEAWHAAGALTHKQNVFDDFEASAHLLIDRRYTASSHLAILGGSNGGLLMGAALVQHPELYHAVVSQVGIYDMLRVEMTPNGAFNVTEFGSTRDPAQFKALFDYSPYHHVKEGVSYPAVLLTTGEHDGRVAPWMSYKMAARLQAANPNGNPVLLRVDPDQGHGWGTSLATALDEDADVNAFLFDQLGMH